MLSSNGAIGDYSVCHGWRGNAGEREGERERERERENGRESEVIISANG